MYNTEDKLLIFMTDESGRLVGYDFISGPDQQLVDYMDKQYKSALECPYVPDEILYVAKMPYDREEDIPELLDVRPSVICRVPSGGGVCRNFLKVFSLKGGNTAPA